MDAIDALRQTRRWRLWVRGTQIELPAFAATFAFVSLGEGHVTRAVVIVVTLTGMIITFVGFCMTAATLPVLMFQYSSTFNGRQSAVLRAFVRDLFSLRKPTPPAEPPWPPPMRRP